MRLIAGRPDGIESNTIARTDPRPSRWHWFIGWLLISALLWWCGRRDWRGRRSATGSARF